jgi:hypothetical protein
MDEASLARTHFPSKRDAWLSIVLWVAAAACVLAGVVNLTAAPIRVGSVSVLIVLCGVAGLILWILYGTHYRFSGETLDIRSGPFRFRVPLGEVVSVEPSRNPLSGPACSLDRLLIRYGRREILVSPEDRLAFLDALATRGSRLVRDGDRIIKRATPGQAATGG